MKPAGVPGAFCADVDPAPEVEPVVAVAETEAAGARLAAALDVGAVVPDADAGVVVVLDAVAWLVPATPALRGEDEL